MPSDVDSSPSLAVMTHVAIQGDVGFGRDSLPPDGQHASETELPDDVRGRHRMRPSRGALRPRLGGYEKNGSGRTGPQGFAVARGRLCGLTRVHVQIRTLIRQMATENEPLKLGFEVSQATVSRSMPRTTKPPLHTWRTFLDIRMNCGASIDFFVAPMATLCLLYATPAGRTGHSTRRHPTRGRTHRTVTCLAMSNPATPIRRTDRLTGTRPTPGRARHIQTVRSLHSLGSEARINATKDGLHDVLTRAGADRLTSPATRGDAGIARNGYGARPEPTSALRDRGNRTVKVVPSSSDDLTVTVPQCAFNVSLVMWSPSPNPWDPSRR